MVAVTVGVFDGDAVSEGVTDGAAAVCVCATAVWVPAMPVATAA